MKALGSPVREEDYWEIRRKLRPRHIPSKRKNEQLDRMNDLRNMQQETILQTSQWMVE